MCDKKTVIRILKGLWSIFGIAFMIIIFGGMILNMANDFTTKANAFFISFSQVSLTLFGITFIGGIFEKLRNSNNSRIKKLFTINIWFLASFIGFMYLYAYQTLTWVQNDSLMYGLTNWFMIAAMLMAFGGLLGGIFSLVTTLLDHYETM